MKSYTIDFAGVKTYYDFYKPIIKGLQAPDWCGENLDAIWDILTGYIELPEVIYVKGGKSLPANLQNKYKLLLETLIEAGDFYKKTKFTVEEIE